MIEAQRWHLSEALQATGGYLALPGGPSVCRGVSTDTRRLDAGQIFVALRGENHDGHHFVEEAVRRQAAAVVIERGALRSPCVEDPGARVSVIEVGDTLRALGDLAAALRRRLRFPVGAVTGSNGKTTTKEMVAAILAVSAGGAEKVLRTTGTENNLIGLPLTLLRARGDEAAAVLELGMNAPGEIWRLTEIADPDVGVVTCVAPAHIEGLGDIDGVARAKGELYRRLRSDATAVVNGDDERVCEIAAAFPGRTVRFGRGAEQGAEQGAEIVAEAITVHGVDGVEFTLALEGERRHVRLPLPGAHNVTNALAAAAVARELGATLDAIAEGLCNLPRLPMRMEVVRLPGPITVINDAYNANPSSMRSALTVLSESGTGAKIAVLGEMRELGDRSAELHEEVGRAAAAAGVDLLVALGRAGEQIGAGAVEGGMPAEAVLVVDSYEDAAARVRERVRPGDHVLIKGSRGSRMEKVLDGLRLVA